MQSEKKIITLCGTFYDESENSLEEFEVKTHDSETDALRYCFEKAWMFLEDQISEEPSSVDNVGMKLDLSGLEAEEQKMLKAGDNLDKLISFRGNDCEFQAVVRKIDAS